MQLILWLKNYLVLLQLYIDMWGRLRKDKTKSVSSFETTHTFFIYKGSYEN